MSNLRFTEKRQRSWTAGAKYHAQNILTMIAIFWVEAVLIIWLTVKEDSRQRVKIRRALEAAESYLTVDCKRAHEKVF